MGRLDERINRAGPVVLVAVTVVVALLLIVAGVGLLLAQRDARDGLTERMYERAEPAGNFVNAALVETARGHAETAAQLVAVPTQENLDAYNDGIGQVVILDASGKLLANSAETAEQRAEARRLLLESVGGRAAVERALAGPVCSAKECRGYVVSDVLGAPRTGIPEIDRPSVGLYVPYRGERGQKLVIADLNSTDLFHGLFQGLFAGAGGVRGSHAYLLDREGRVISDDRRGTTHLGRRPADRALTDAVADGPRGGYESTAGEDAHYATKPVPRTDWSVAVTTPDERLYASVTGATRWMPWLLLLGLVFAAAAALLALRASQRRGAALVAASAAKTTFLANASHELRTPLNGIIGFSQLLYDGKLGELDDTQREAVHDVLSSAEHLNRLVSGLLDITRAESGHLEIHPEPLRLADVIDEVRTGVQAVADEHQIDVTVSVSEDLPEEVVLDPTRTRQILFNYLTNAIKFTPEGGSVSITAERENPREFRIAVRDTGPGLSPAAIERLFQRYERLSNREAEGTGLGLVVTRDIAEAHGGRVGVESTLGEGATFFVILPLEHVAEAAEARS